MQVCGHVSNVLKNRSATHPQCFRRTAKRFSDACAFSGSFPRWVMRRHRPQFLTPQHRPLFTCFEYASMTC